MRGSFVHLETHCKLQGIPYKVQGNTFIVLGSLFVPFGIDLVVKPAPNTKASLPNLTPIALAIKQLLQ